MFVREIEIAGFKSYAQRTQVGPFDPAFNAITGLNGSGKSNILDAICFVLGLQNTKTMRADNLQGLVYKSGQAGVTKATVAITFDNGDRANSPPTYESYNEIVVSRTVIIGGRSKFHVNNLIANQERVIDLFRSVQLNVNNPHFLIMQGRVQQVLRMKPLEILGMIEEAAGTRLYETKKEKAQRTIQKKEKLVNEINEMLTDDIEPQVEQYKRDKEAYQQFQSVDREYQELDQKNKAYEFTQLKGGGAKVREEIESHRQFAEKKQDEKTALEGEKEKLLSQSQELKEQLQHDPAVAECDKVLVQASKELKEAKGVENEQATKMKKVEREIRAKEKQIDTESESLARKESDLAAAGSSLGEAETVERDIALRMERAQAKLDALMQGRDTDEHGNQVSVRQQLIDARSKAAETETALKNAKACVKERQPKLTRLEKELGQLARRSHSGEIDAAKQQIAQLEAESAQLQERLRALGDDGDEALRDADARKGELRQIVTREAHKIRKWNHEHRLLGFEYNPPANFDRTGVHGKVAALLRLERDECALALERAAGAKLGYVVVDTDRHVQELLGTPGTLNSRTFFIPLNKVNAWPADQAKLHRARLQFGDGNVFFAKDCVSYDERFTRAIQFAFGDTLIFREAEMARFACYEMRVNCRCIAMNGDDFNPSGRITGGYARSWGTMALLNEYGDAKRAVREATRKLADIDEQVERRRAGADERRQLAKRIEHNEMRAETLRMKVGDTDEHRLQSDIDALRHEIEAADATVADCERQMAALRGREKELQEKISNADAYKKAEQKRAETELRQLKKEKSERKDEFARSKETLDTLRADIGDLKETIGRLKAELEPMRLAMAECGGEMQRRGAAVAEKLQARESAERAKKSAEGVAQRRRKEHEQLQADVAAHTGRIHDKELAIFEASSKMDQLKEQLAEAEHTVERMRRQHAWIHNDEHLFGAAGSRFDFAGYEHAAACDTLKRLRADLDGLRVNADFQLRADQLANDEKECASLRARKLVLENDRAKLEETIRVLDQKKRDQIMNAYKRVNVDFDDIFCQLLPGTKAKLALPAGAQSPLDGLEIRVALGDDWKESLEQLSGGQKSLVALSLILAMLKFKPAPIYILDEVDAALDLSHTQNIGAMIKKHFKNSQFIIVSLKDGMFNHANVLFKTRFVDGCSTVTRHADRR